MPITFAQSEPFSEATSREQGALEQTMRDREFYAKEQQRQAQLQAQQFQQELAAAQFGQNAYQFEAQRQPSERDQWAVAQETEHRQQQQRFQMDYQRQGFDLQGKLQQTQLTQAENLRMQRLQRQLDYVQAQGDAGTFTPDQVRDYQTQLHTGLDPLAQRHQESQQITQQLQQQNLRAQIAEQEAIQQQNDRFRNGGINELIRYHTGPNGEQIPVWMDRNGSIHQLHTTPAETAIQRQQREEREIETYGSRLSDIERELMDQPDSLYSNVVEQRPDGTFRQPTRRETGATPNSIRPLVEAEIGRRARSRTERQAEDRHLSLVIDHVTTAVNRMTPADQIAAAVAAGFTGDALGVERLIERRIQEQMRHYRTQRGGGRNQGGQSQNTIEVEGFQRLLGAVTNQNIPGAGGATQSRPNEEEQRMMNTPGALAARAQQRDNSAAGLAQDPRSDTPRAQVTITWLMNRPWLFRPPGFNGTRAEAETRWRNATWEERLRWMESQRRAEGGQ